MENYIDHIDNVTASLRKAGALLRAAEEGSRGRDRAWLVQMALEAIEAGESALPGLNRPSARPDLNRLPQAED